jgi:hypothetical protein
LIYLSFVVAEAAAEEQRKIEAAKRNGKIEVRYNHYKVPLLPALPFLTFSTFFVVATAVVKGNRKEEFHHQCLVFFFLSRSKWTLRWNQEVGLLVASVTVSCSIPPPFFPFFLIGDQCHVQFFFPPPPPFLKEKMDKVDGI